MACTYSGYATGYIQHLHSKLCMRESAGARKPPHNPTHPRLSPAIDAALFASRDDEKGQGVRGAKWRRRRELRRSVGEGVMRWRGEWAARVLTPSLHSPLAPAARDPIILWQVGPWRRGAGRHCVLMKLLQLATRQRAVLGATSLVFDDSFGHLNPQTWLSGDLCARA